MEKEKEFFKNPLGINIVKCCASCKHKALDGGTSRICKIGEGAVKPSYVCSDWEMSENYAKAGIGGGRIKKKHYLAYVLECYDNEAKKAEKPKDIKIPIKQVERDYEKQFGSIYINEK